MAETDRISVSVVRLAHARGLPLPAYASDGSAGMDLRAAIEAEQSVAPSERLQIPTGLILELPVGWEGQVRPRSGLALRHGVTLLNSPGTIDSDYRGEVKVIVINLGQSDFVVERGDRIAQLVVSPVAQVVVVEVDSLSSTGRGEGGFGSTGVG
jgi:dUTP pyrophosphatase